MQALAREAFPQASLPWLEVDGRGRRTDAVAPGFECLDQILGDVL
jgi:hypothetical protein